MQIKKEIKHQTQKMWEFLITHVSAFFHYAK